MPRTKKTPITKGSRCGHRWHPRIIGTVLTRAPDVCRLAITRDGDYRSSVVTTGDNLQGNLPREQALILVVEDDPLMSEIYGHALAKGGFKWEVVADGSDAFHRLHQKQFDLVILDLMLPSMDGLAMLRRIRAQKKFLVLPILVITAVNIATIQGQLNAAGASLIMAKTEVVPQILIEAVKSLIAAAPRQPLDLLPTPKIEEPLIEELRQRPDFRVQPPVGSAASPMPQIRMASLPDSGLASASSKLGVPVDPPGVNITEETGKSKTGETVPKKAGFFSRMFGRK